jgi:peptidoglycan/LPS O-acetylase OafA/YrhL
VFGIGLALTTVPAGEYLTSPLTWRFLWRWGTIVNGFAYSLPGLFENSPFDQKVNGSLWTVTVEWRLYMILAAGWFVLALFPAWRRMAFRLAMPIVALALYLQVTIPEVANLGAQHSFCFFAGSSIYLFGDRIPVGPKPLLATIAAFALGLASKQAFFYVYVALLPYLVLNLAYMPGRWLLRFNGLGDYSYGLYIYAYPISQAVIALKPGIGLTPLTLWSAPLTLIPAVLSWRFVEKPALARKEAMAAKVTRAIDALRAFRFSPASGGGSSPFPARPWRKPDAPALREAEQREPVL